MHVSFSKQKDCVQHTHHSFKCLPLVTEQCNDIMQIIQTAGLMIPVVVNNRRASHVAVSKSPLMIKIRQKFFSLCVLERSHVITVVLLNIRHRHNSAELGFNFWFSTTIRQSNPNSYVSIKTPSKQLNIRQSSNDQLYIIYPYI